MTKKEFNNHLISAEDDLKLFDVEICGKKLWKYLRIGFSSYLLDYELDLLNDNPFWMKNYKKNILKVLKNRWKSIGSDIFFRDLPIFLPKSDILYFTPGYNKIENGYTVDRYIEDYILSTPKDISFSVIEFSILESNFVAINPKIKNKYYISHEMIISYYSFKQKPSEQEIYSEIVKKIIEPIENITKIRFADKAKKRITYEAVFHIYYGDAYYNFFIKVLNIAKPKLILFYHSDELRMQQLFEACKNFNIPLVEIQHGMASSTFNDFTFVTKSDVDLVCPSYIVASGKVGKEMWAKENYNCNYGIASEDIKPIGKISLDEKVVRQKIQNQNQNQNRPTHYLIISPELHPKLMDFTLKLANIVKDSKIICKLHMTSIYNPILEPLKACENVTIRSDTPIYNLIEWADYIIGEDTTVLFESVKFGKSVFFFEEFSNTHPLIEKKLAKGITDVEDFLEKIKDSQNLILNPEDINYFYADNAKENYQNFLREIVHNT